MSTTSVGTGDELQWTCGRPGTPVEGQGSYDHGALVPMGRSAEHGVMEPADLPRPRRDDRPLVFDGRADRRAERVSIREILGAPAAGSRWARRIGILGWAAAGATAVGGVWFVRDILFPDLGPPAAESVWQNPGIAAAVDPAESDERSGPVGAVDLTTTIATVPLAAADAVLTDPPAGEGAPAAAGTGTAAPPAGGQAGGQTGTGAGGPGPAVTASPGPAPGAPIDGVTTATTIPRAATPTTTTPALAPTAGPAPTSPPTSGPTTTRPSATTAPTTTTPRVTTPPVSAAASTTTTPRTTTTAPRATSTTAPRATSTTAPSPTVPKATNPPAPSTTAPNATSTTVDDNGGDADRSDNSGKGSGNSGSGNSGSGGGSDDDRPDDPDVD